MKSKMSVLIIIPIIFSISYFVYMLDAFSRFDSLLFLTVHKEVGGPDKDWHNFATFFSWTALIANLIFLCGYVWSKKKSASLICFVLILLTLVTKQYGLELADAVYRSPFAQVLDKMSTEDLIEESLKDRPVKESVYINKELKTRLDDMFDLATSKKLDIDNAMVISSEANAQKDPRFYTLQVDYARKLMLDQHPWYEKLLFLISRPVNHATLERLDDLESFVRANNLPEDYVREIKKWRNTVINRMKLANE